MKWNKWRFVALLLSVVAVLASSGCPGTNILPNGNATLQFEVVLAGQTVNDYDCINFMWNEIDIVPLDGTCAPGSPNEDEPCFRPEDCAPFNCEDSASSAVLGESGYEIQTSVNGTTGLSGNLLGGPCSPQKTCDAASDVPGELCDVNDDCGVTGNCILDLPFDPSSEPFFQPLGVVLPQGLYRMDLIRFGRINFFNEADEIYARCTSTKTVTEAFDESVTHFVLGSGDSKTIRVEIDAAMLESLFEPPPANSSNCKKLFDDDQAWANFLATINLTVD